MNYEFFDLGLIFINLLFCGLLLHRTNKINKKLAFLEKKIEFGIKNPKEARKRLNSDKV